MTNRKEWKKQLENDLILSISSIANLIIPCYFNIKKLKTTYLVESKLLLQPCIVKY